MISKLGRKKDERNTLIANLATSLVLHGKIKTTHSKAKTAQPYVERIFSLAKKDTLASRRYVSKLLLDKKAIAKIFEIGLPNIKTISSGFTSIVKLNPRRGDGAAMSLLMLNEKIFLIKDEAVLKNVKTKVAK